jgi:hypothetical protein
MIEAGAKFSSNRRYRYALWRPVPYTKEVSVRTCVFIGLNPSTADETTDDPTIRRCSGFALREGCGILVMLNLFAFCATNPADLIKHGESRFSRGGVIGPGNNSALMHYCTKAPIEPLVIAAWGNHGSFMARDREVVDMLTAANVKLHRLGALTLQNQPRHPLYLEATAGLSPLAAPSI